MFDARIEHLDEGRLWKYELTIRDTVIPYCEALQLMAESREFREFLVTLLVDSPFDAYRWETPPITQTNSIRQFEFILFRSSKFTSRMPDVVAFQEHFTNDDSEQGIVAFPNLRGDSTMIVPSPRTSHSAYGHLAAFIRQAPSDQVDMLWQVVGKTTLEQIHDQPIWLSTAGGGVAWLHVRIDPHPKYYSYTPYKKSP